LARLTLPEMVAVPWIETGRGAPWTVTGTGDEASFVTLTGCEGPGVTAGCATAASKASASSRAAAEFIRTAFS
jgi:hypothetical protein